MTTLPEMLGTVMTLNFGRLWTAECLRTGEDDKRVTPEVRLGVTVIQSMVIVKLMKARGSTEQEAATRACAAPDKVAALTDEEWWNEKLLFHKEVAPFMDEWIAVTEENPPFPGSK